MKKSKVKYDRFCIDDVLEYINKNKKRLKKAWKEYHKNNE